MKYKSLSAALLIIIALLLILFYIKQNSNGQYELKINQSTGVLVIINTKNGDTWHTHGNGKFSGPHKLPLGKN